jgi:hypothetical protein
MYMTPRQPIESREDSLREPPSLAALLLVTMAVIYDPQLAEYTKTTPQTGGSSYI